MSEANKSDAVATRAFRMTVSKIIRLLPWGFTRWLCASTQRI